MAETCTHLGTIRKVTPSARGCEECLKIGQEWFHLRVCRSCGHVGCCDQSKGKHATKHFHRSKHPIIEGYDPPEGWGLVLCGRSDVRSGRRRHATGWPHTPLLLKGSQKIACPRLAGGRIVGSQEGRGSLVTDGETPPRP